MSGPQYQPTTPYRRNQLNVHISFTNDTIEWGSYFSFLLGGPKVVSRKLITRRTLPTIDDTKVRMGKMTWTEFSEILSNYYATQRVSDMKDIVRRVELWFNVSGILNTLPCSTEYPFLNKIPIMLCLKTKFLPSSCSLYFPVYRGNQLRSWVDCTGIWSQVFVQVLFIFCSEFIFDWNKKDHNRWAL